MIEVQVLKSKIVINSSSPGITTRLISKLRDLGIDVDVIIENVRCG